MDKNSPRYYPLFVNITEKQCLVVGGGEVARRKIEALLEVGARVRVVSPQCCKALLSLEERGSIEIEHRPYQSNDLIGAILVFAATNNREVNAEIARDARQHGILVNSADAPEEGDFITASTLRRGSLCIALTTGGANPTLSAHLMRGLERRFGAEYADFVEMLGDMRDTIKQVAENPEMRRHIYRKLLEQEQELCNLLAEGEIQAAKQRAEAIVASALQI